MVKPSDQYRKIIRLKDYDYSSAGYYFVTIVSYKRKNIFGEIIDGQNNLNPLGIIVEKTWREIPAHFPYIEVDSHIVMPNHFHGILIISEIRAQHVRAQHAEPLRETKAQPLGLIIRSFKSAVTKRVHDLGLFIGEKIWHRNYYEHIIRDEEDYQSIAEYIETNPLNWQYDHDNPEHIEP